MAALLDLAGACAGAGDAGNLHSPFAGLPSSFLRGHLPRPTSNEALLETAPSGDGKAARPNLKRPRAERHTDDPRASASVTDSGDNEEEDPLFVLDSADISGRPGMNAIRLQSALSLGSLFNEPLPTLQQVVRRRISELKQQQEKALQAYVCLCNSGGSCGGGGAAAAVAAGAAVGCGGPVPCSQMAPPAAALFQQQQQQRSAGPAQPQGTVSMVRILTCKTYCKRLNVTRSMADRLLPPAPAGKPPLPPSTNNGEHTPYTALFRVPLTLLDPANAEWPVVYEGTVCRHQRHYRLTAGWPAFLRAQGAGVGDAVVFERGPGEAPGTLRARVVKGADASALAAEDGVLRGSSGSSGSGGGADGGAPQ